MNVLRNVRIFSPLLIVAALLSAMMAHNAMASSPLFQIKARTQTGDHQWKIELASTPQARARGLMFVKSMPAYTGMLFRFDTVEEVSMWMKNTFIPLDMIFISEEGSVAHIHRSAEPHSLAVISSNGPVRYVLEINAGEADKAGLKPGVQLLHPWFAFSE